MSAAVLWFEPPLSYVSLTASSVGAFARADDAVFDDFLADDARDEPLGLLVFFSEDGSAGLGTWPPAVEVLLVTDMPDPVQVASRNQ
ncbi:MAG: hypothetical protein AAFN74_05175 [Myxococcota bacterium]